MSNETKRDVFEGLLESYMYSADMVIDEISTDGVADRLNLGNIIASTRDRYDNALPDDLPVIPKAVGRMITKMKPTCNSILASQYRDYGKDHRWIIDHYDTFARAWLLGVWRVEETGEVVKL